MSWLPEQNRGNADYDGIAAFRSRRRIADFVTYLTIDENGEDELEITDHPVQEGAEITDHAYKKPPMLNVTISFSESDENSVMTLDETYAAMLELQESRVPFEVVTGKRIYTNMLFKSLRQTTDKNTDNVLSIQAILKHVILTTVTITSVPPRARQKNPAKTGATSKAGSKKAQEVDTQKQPAKKSALKKIIGGS
jgi:hypothetical protein